jgi:transcriptional regulator with XRE-family HTH domain
MIFTDKSKGMSPTPPPARIRPTLEDFASILVAARQAAGLRQTDLAAAAGLTSSYLSFLENRKKPPPSDEVCRRLEKALELPEGRLLEPAHLERAPKALREKVDSLTSSLHRERRSLRTFMEGLLSPFLFAGPPGFRDSAIDALGVSPTRRRRIREAVRRGERSKVKRILDELTEKELRDLADQLPRLLPAAPALHDAPPEVLPDAPFLLVAPEDAFGEIRAGDRLLLDPHATPQDGDLLALRDGGLRRLRRENGNYRLEGEATGAMPAAELFHRLERTLAGVVLEIRRVIPR